MISRGARTRSLQQVTNRRARHEPASGRARRGRARHCRAWDGRDGARRPSRETRRCFDPSSDGHGCVRSSGTAHPPIASMLRRRRAGVAARPSHGAKVVDRGSIAPTCADGPRASGARRQRRAAHPHRQAQPLVASPRRRIRSGGHHSWCLSRYSQASRRRTGLSRGFIPAQTAVKQRQQRHSPARW